ncbi:class I SAM-dependent methyltransferase [Microbulbifer sp. YPW1]|uniref:class I SAM-dependent methyltransferase n=1 Tax=Microbulbifer sp. YPW1 TaxID=2745199 RepID=UPI0015999025|nr:methyltransferase [Microbulbifer sp. YPW1]QKX18074.1 methyltransferase [Microbulbifer sp. YPW1]
MQTTLLSQFLRDGDPDTLWIADENSKPLLDTALQFSGVLLSNRWDIAQAAEARGIRTEFCDFELAASKRQYSRIVYPVSKEKAAVHHIINCAPGILREGGELLLLGGKTSGIKTYAQKTAQRFGCAKQLQKHGSDYLSRSQARDTAAGPELDDSEYPQLRQLDVLGGLYSKPGLFGWNKIDTGSALLASHFDEHLPAGGIRVVDLGCGYGYLSTQLARAAGQDCRPFIEATDNNAAALLACEKNFQAREIAGRVVAGDAGSELESKSADLLVCNPPFHQGFQVEGDLTDRFLGQAARILKKGGTALFVVNEFIPLEKKSQALFQQVVRLNKEKGFCVYRLTR